MVLPNKNLHISKAWGKDMVPKDNWSACKIRGAHRDIVVISLYLKDGEGLSHTNLARLGQVHELVLSLKVPWVILGDFNMNPGTLEAGGLLDLWGGGQLSQLITGLSLAPLGKVPCLTTQLQGMTSLIPFMSAKTWKHHGGPM